MQKIYLVTGSDGHLGSTIVKQLIEKGCSVRGLRMKNSTLKTPIIEDVYYGDVRDFQSMKDFFDCDNAVIIHTAGIVTISKKMNQRIYDTNVIGTQNIIKYAKKINARLIYVSSVHAIDIDDYISYKRDEEYPFNVEYVSKTDAYSKTKALATQFVRKASKGIDKIDINIVYPSGIMGPGDYGKNLINQVIKEYMKGKIFSYLNGGYNLIDVRCAANAIVNLCVNEKLINDEYLVTGDYISIKNLFNTLSELLDIKKPKITFPYWVLKILIPVTALYFKIKKMAPLYCNYSFETLKKRVEFDNSKTLKDLNIKIPPLKETLLDTIDFYKKHDYLM